MPTYDFECEKGHSFEHTCKMAEIDNPVACPLPDCGAAAQNMCNFGGLDHGIGMYRDQANEGRFDEDNLSTRFMSSGRGAWQRR